MQTLTINTKRTAENVGQRISREYADRLINGFKQKFPNEKQLVFISKKTILNAIKQAENISGLRFMYGFDAMNDVDSRVILMVPCNNTSTQLAIPNSIILPEGYLTNKGTKLNFDKTWQVLYNHTLRFGKYFPEAAYNQIMRGSFIGINSLHTLLESEECIGINFNFGYDETIPDVASRNKPVFAAVNSFGFDIDIFDFTMPCPSMCDPVPPFNLGKIGAVDTKIQVEANNSLKLTPQFRDEFLLKNVANGGLVEMFYYANPSIYEKVMAGDSSKELYESVQIPQITKFNSLIEKGNFEEAKIVFEKTIKGMIHTYLFQ